MLSGCVAALLREFVGVDSEDACSARLQCRQPIDHARIVVDRYRTELCQDDGRVVLVLYLMCRNLLEVAVIDCEFGTAVVFNFLAFFVFLLHPLRTHYVHSAVCVEAELVDDVVIEVHHLLVLAGLYINGIENGMTYRAVFVPAVAHSEEGVARRVVSHVVECVAQRAAIAVAVPCLLLFVGERADMQGVAGLEVDS